MGDIYCGVRSNISVISLQKQDKLFTHPVTFTRIDIYFRGKQMLKINK